MDYVSYIIDVFLHLDKYLGVIINNYGLETYLILFFIIFIETGLVITPFLPGDSLIFAGATFAAIGMLNKYVLIATFIVAAILGDTVNYEVGRHLGEKLLKHEKLIKKEHIDKTNSFYEKYGGKTIVFARFIPIVRTLAPFVAGIGKMNYKKFISFNAFGGVLWVAVVFSLGFFFGNIEIVKKNFSIVIIGIIVISVIPVFVNIMKNKMIKSKYDETLQ